MSSQVSKVEVDGARDRLSGALSSAVDRFGGNEELAAHGIFGSPNKRLHSLDSPLGSPTKSPRPQRRRRKKEVPQTSAFHHTFVMKLFDRSVDLAQFPEGTSLYPVCRAWMKNQPNNTNMAPRERTPTPEPDSDSESAKIKTEAKEPENEGTDKVETEEADKEQTEEEEDEEDLSAAIYKMPTHESLPKDDQGVLQTLRIPTPVDREPMDPDFLDAAKKASSQPEKDGLLNDHMERWLKVRRRWREAAAKNEERYRPSMDLLREMFEK